VCAINDIETTSGELVVTDESEETDDDDDGGVQPYVGFHR